ncbi:MAG: serine hydrolase [Thermoanaerobaculia bacterium]
MSSKPLPGADNSIAAAEVSLYESIIRVKREHRLTDLAISFYDYESTLQWSYNADAWFHAASTMKLAVLLAVFRQIERGELALTADVHVRNRFISIVNGQPFMLDLDRDADPDVYGNLGRSMTVHELARQMITRSSNLATNLLIDIVGVSTIQQTIDELDISGVRVIRGVEDQAAFDAGLNNEVTANGLVALLRTIEDRRAWREESASAMLQILHEQEFKSGIPAGLPGEARVAHKTGNISTVHHDAGLVYFEDRRPYALAVLTSFPADVGRTGAVAAISRDIFQSLAGRLHE